MLIVQTASTVQENTQVQQQLNTMYCTGSQLPHESLPKYAISALSAYVQFTVCIFTLR